MNGFEKHHSRAVSAVNLTRIYTPFGKQNDEIKGALLLEKHNGAVIEVAE